MGTFPDNQLKKVVLGTALLLGTLISFSFLPEIEIGSFRVKRINLLSDVEIKKTKAKLAVKPDSVAAISKAIVDTCLTDITCIEDFSEDSTGLNSFLTGLDSSRLKPVRIAFFGDSYVEGDIIIDPLRDSLQALFGGSGVGFVPITSDVAGFRQTIRHSFKDWKTLSMVGEKDDLHPLGPSGFTAYPLETGFVSYQAVKRNRLSTFQNTYLFYGKNTTGTLVFNQKDTLILDASHKITKLKIGNASKGIQFEAKGNVDLYGISVEDKAGISIDNFAVRGNSGVGLYSVKEKMYHQFDSIHPYNLVVLAYGLNVASDKAKNYDWYERSMGNTIAMIKRAFPHASILLLSCSDRSANIDGTLQTMPMLKELVDVQRKLAVNNKICFWNMFEAMGGDSTMVRWADEEKPALANKDYTHLTFKGGKKLAYTLLSTLIYEKFKFDNRKKKVLVSKIN